MRIQVNGANVLEEYAYDGAQMVAAFGPNQSVVWSATWGPGLDNLISIKRGDATFLALSDGRGSIGTYVNELKPSTSETTHPGTAIQVDTWNICDVQRTSTNRRLRERSGGTGPSSGSARVVST